MRVRISQRQYELLKTSEETMTLFPSFLVAGPDLVLEGTGYALSEFRDACEDVLIRLGLDESYYPNSDGVLLEDLIDKMFEG